MNEKLAGQATASCPDQSARGGGVAVRERGNETCVTLPSMRGYGSVSVVRVQSTTGGNKGVSDLQATTKLSRRVYMFCEYITWQCDCSERSLQWMFMEHANPSQTVMSRLANRTTANDE